MQGLGFRVYPPRQVLSCSSASSSSGASCQGQASIGRAPRILQQVSELQKTTVDDRNYLKDLKLWELWSIPYYGYCRVDIINRSR